MFHCPEICYSSPPPPSVCSVLYFYVWICTKDMTTLSTLKKTVIVSPSTWTYGTKLIQASYVKLQLEKTPPILKIQLKKKKHETLASLSYFTTYIHLVSNKKINITKTFFSTICVFWHPTSFHSTKANRSSYS